MSTEQSEDEYLADLYFIDWEIEKKKKTKDKRIIAPKEDLPPKL
jgi:hypothetical protein